MKMKVAWLVMLLIVGMIVVIVAITESSRSLPQLSSVSGSVERGAYLARISGCIACHTDIDGGGKPLAGGAPIETDFGVFYSPNLTTHKKAGIGGWTIEQFAKAVREGISPVTGDRYYPVFPYTFYSGFSDQDIADLWVAFNTVKPATGKEQSHTISFPFNLRSGLVLWQLLFFDDKSVAADVAGQGRRGEFLVETAAHCGACHTQRNFLGALDRSAWLAGAKNLPGDEVAPSIRGQELSSSGWKVIDISYALSTGIKPDGDVMGGSMGEVIRHGTRYMNKQDRDAIAQYLLEYETD